MKESILVPLAGSFLPGTGIKKLRRMQRLEKDPVSAQRLTACIKRKEGMTIRQIAKDLGRGSTTINTWLSRIHREGTDARHSRHPPGAQSLLDPEQTVQLRADLIAGPDRCGFASSLWTAPLLAAHIKKKFGVEYATINIYDILHRMGFSPRADRGQDTQRQPQNPHKQRLKKSWNGDKTPCRKGIQIMPLTRHPTSQGGTPRTGGTRSAGR